MVRAFACLVVFLALIPSAKAATLDFEDDVSSSSVSRLISQVAQASSRGDRNITVVLNSPGGDLKAALSGNAALKRYHVNTFVRQDCSSSCTVLFAAGVHREASSGATFLFHGVGVSGMKGSHAQKKADKAYYLNKYAQYWLQAVREASPSLANYLQANQILTRGEREFTGRELRSYGFVN